MLCALTLADDMLEWLEGQPEGTRGDIEAYVQDQAGQSLDALRRYEGNAELTNLLQTYCDEHNIRPQVASTVKARLRHIYDQLTSPDLPGGPYAGLLFVIDEYEGWEKSRPRGSPQQARDEDLLETMAFVLTKGEGGAAHPHHRRLADRGAGQIARRTRRRSLHQRSTAGGC